MISFELHWQGKYIDATNAEFILNIAFNKTVYHFCAKVNDQLTPTREQRLFFELISYANSENVKCSAEKGKTILPSVLAFHHYKDKTITIPTFDGPRFKAGQPYKISMITTDGKLKATCAKVMQLHKMNISDKKEEGRKKSIEEENPKKLIPDILDFWRII